MIGAIREENLLTTLSSRSPSDSTTATAKLDAHDIANRPMFFRGSFAVLAATFVSLVVAISLIVASLLFTGQIWHISMTAPTCFFLNSSYNA